MLLCSTAWADTHTAASCENKAGQTDVQTAVDASSSGDIVAIPAGSCTWDTTVTVVNKNITVQGAGKASTLLTADGGKRLTFTNNSSSVKDIGFTNLYLSLKAGQSNTVHDCSFVNPTESITYAISLYGDGVGNADHPYAVIYNNTFNNTGVLTYGDAGTFTDNNSQHALWAQQQTSGSIGTAANGIVTIEGNTFYGSIFMNAANSNMGGRFIFRYNTILDSAAEGNHGLWVENHPAGTGSRGGQRTEVYNNIFSNDGAGSLYAPVYLRAGSGVVFNNTVIGNWANYQILLDNIRSETGVCDGTSDWDGNEAGQSGWLCRDQIGAGYDTTQWENSPVGANTQTKVPFHQWNNKYGETDVVFHVLDSSLDHIILNRDFYNSIDVSFTQGTCPHPLTGLTGSCGSTAGVGGYNISGVTANQSFGSTTASGAGRKMGSTTASGSGFTIQ